MPADIFTIHPLLGCNLLVLQLFGLKQQLVGLASQYANVRCREHVGRHPTTLGVAQNWAISNTQVAKKKKSLKRMTYTQSYSMDLYIMIQILT